MRALAIVHQPDAGPGVFANALRATRAELDLWHLRTDRSPPGDPFGYDAVLTLGGAMHPDQHAEHPWLADEKALLADLLEHRVPLLGVCLGAQLLAAAAGSITNRAAVPEIGWFEVEQTPAARHDPLFERLPPRFAALEWHSYEFALPTDAAALAYSERCLQAYRIGDRAWGIQFHAEVTLEGFERWIRDYRSDEDAVRLELDAGDLARVTRERIAAWNSLGLELCERFIQAAARCVR